MQLGRIVKALWSSRAATLSSTLTQRNLVAMGSSPSNEQPTLRGVIFDMDGTLTIPNLDFAEMYARCSVDQKDDILAAIARMTESDAAKANAIVEEMEEEGRRTLQLMPGTVSLLQWLAHYNIPVALVTRNTFRSTQRLQELLQEVDPSLPEFYPIVARDTEPIHPPKPDASALKYIASQWSVELSKEFVMVGDSPANDIMFGKNAGVSTALLWQSDIQLENQGGADLMVSHLSQLPRHLKHVFNLSPKALPKVPAPQPTSPAGRAAFTGDIESLKSLSLDELTATDDTGNTPLIWAVEGGQEKALDFILGALSSKTPSPQLDLHLNAKGFLHSTAVSRAARNGNTSILDILTKHPINANIPNIKLQYPLHIAAFRRHKGIVQRLLEAGADPHVVDQKGRTPLEDTNCEEIQGILQTAMVWNR